MQNSAIWINQKEVASPCLEVLKRINTKTSVQTQLHSDKAENITAITRCNDLLAVGRADGSVCLLQALQEVTVFHGHRAAITALEFDSSAQRLISGSQDGQIVLWDIVSEQGLVRFKGHKDQITQLKFLSFEKLNHIVSCSKDSLVKIWDIGSQMCVETVVSHRGEIWALDILLSDKYSFKEEDLNESTEKGMKCTMFTGAADGQVRIWSIDARALDLKLSKSQASISNEPEIESSCSLLGTFDRQSKERIMTLKVHPNGECLGVQGADKMIEIFKFRSQYELVKTLNRRRKRIKKLQKSQDKMDDEQDVKLSMADRIVSLQVIRCSGKVRSFDFNPFTTELQVLATVTNNALEVYEIDSEKTTRQVSAIDLEGHRSDIRTVSLSSDDGLLMTGSNDLLKVWSMKTMRCLHTMESGYALCSTFLPGIYFLNLGNKNVLIGTKTGDLELYDLNSSSLLESYKAHSGPIWSLQLKPDKLGIVTGSQDKQVKFWDFKMVLDTSYSTITKRVTLCHTRTLKLSDDVLCCRISPDSRLLAVSLIDLTVKIFYMDSLKFFISLYGHKLPVVSIDISFDSKLIITGSSDKTVKIWGLDFGDCHKSLLCHTDSVMSVKFVWGTYFFFTVSKDKTIKYWCAEKFEEITKLTNEGSSKAHFGEIWALDVGKYGNFIVTASHDRSIRIWEKTDEQVGVIY